MAHLSEGAVYVIDTLKARGVPASLNAENANLPGAIVVPGEVSFETFSDGVSISWDVYLVAKDYGVMEALEALGGLLIKVSDLVHEGNVEATTLTIGGQQMSALKFNIITRVS